MVLAPLREETAQWIALHELRRVFALWAAGGGEARKIRAFYCLGLCWSVESGLFAPFCFFFCLLFWELLSFELGSLV